MKLTKKLKKQLVRELIDSIKTGAWFTPVEVECFNELTGFNYKQYRKKYHENDLRHIWVKDINETRSWLKQIDDPNRERRDSINARIAMRYDIRDQIPATDTECASCGAQTDLCVDHKSTAFKDIADDFLAAAGTIETDNPEGLDYGHGIKDDSTRKAWQDYHRELADYQTLCRSCNSSKGARKV